MRSILTFCITLSVFLHSSVHAGTTGKLVGKVTDAQSREAVIGASVVIEGTSMGAATDIEGDFVILNVPPGTYRVAASAVGYVKMTMAEVIVNVDLTTRVDFQLQPTIIEGEEVVVTAERKAIKRDLTSSEARVDASTIRTLPVSEVAEVLSLQAGITVDRGGGVHIRGGRTNEVAYWIDGVSVSDVYEGGQSIQVENRFVQELQVISGTFNAEYGQAMSGIVNIVTKDGDRQFRGNLMTYTGDWYTRDDGIFYHLDDVNPFANHNIEGSFSGPVPGIEGLTFFTSARYFRGDGRFYGNRVFATNGNPIDSANVLYDNGNVQGLNPNNPPNRPVPMDPVLRRTGQFKLSYPFSGTMKLSVNLLGHNITSKDYDHFWRYVPDAVRTKTDKSYTLSSIWTHTVSATSFYTLGLTHIDRQFKHVLFESPADKRYVLDPTATTTAIYEFARAGTQNDRFQRRTRTEIVKLDYTDQLSKLHQLKLGAEGRLHRLFLEDYALTFDQQILADSGFYQNLIPPFDSPNYRRYTERPIELSAYAQDKLEYENMVVNIGVRVDYFNSRGHVLADPTDPNVFLPQKPQNRFRDLNGNGTQDPGEPEVTLDERLAYWYKKARPKWALSPRLGVSYPITDRGVLHFSYGHFLQIPSFNHLFQNPGYKVTTQSGIQGVFGNPDLDVQRTVMYEFGLQQQVSEDVSFDITGFYRDTRDWVSTSAPIPVRDELTATTHYTIFVNRDYANSRGITLTVNKRPVGLLSANFSYTFQIAEGVNSSPDAEQGARVNNEEPARALSPLDWDQRHTANLTLGVSESDWGVFLVGRYGSGLPYTPQINQADEQGVDAARVDRRNARLRPASANLDLRLFKNFTFNPVTLSIFVKVFNVFDTRNEVEVYAQTGRASATPEALGVGQVGGANRLNTVQEYLLRPDYYSEPREIQVGFEISF